MQLKEKEVFKTLGNIADFEMCIDDDLDGIDVDKLDVKERLLKSIAASLYYQNHLLNKRNELLEEQNEHLKYGLGNYPGGPVFLEKIANLLGANDKDSKGGIVGAINYLAVVIDSKS